MTTSATVPVGTETGQVPIWDGSSWAPGDVPGAPVFVQDADPGMTDPGLWIDTSGGNVTFWFEDGL